MKTCIKCSSEKSKDSFHKDARRDDGLFPYCNECRKTPKKPSYFRPIQDVLANHSISKGGCWEWSGTLTRDGYGVACYKGKRIRAHRLSYIHFTGETDLLVLHHCDNRKCINPEHLYAGTNQDNSNDMVFRNRTAPVRGEKSALAKLTSCEAIEIYNESRRHKDIAVDYGVSPSTVSGIKTGRLWAESTKMDRSRAGRNEKKS